MQHLHWQWEGENHEPGWRGPPVPGTGESYMSERPVLWRACSPVLTLHHAVIRRRATERDSISFVVGADASEGAAPSNSSLEVVNMGRAPGLARLVDYGCHFCPAKELGRALYHRSPRRGCPAH